MKDNNMLNNDLKKDNNDMCVKSSKILATFFLLLGLILAFVTIFALVSNKSIIFSLVIGFVALALCNIALDSFKEFKVVDNKIVYTMLFFKKEIEITDSIRMKCEKNLPPNEHKNNGTVTIYNGESKFCAFGNLDNFTINKFIEIAKCYMMNVSIDGSEMRPTLNDADIKELDSWIDKCENETPNKALETNEAVISSITDSQLGNINFYKGEDEFENTIVVCEKFKFGKYNPKIIIPEEFYEEEIPLYIKTIKKVYEMRKDVIKTLLKETLMMCDNWGETDKDNNKITMEYVKEYFDVESLYIDSYESEDSNGNTSETIFFEVDGYISDNREDNDLLLGYHAIKASVSSSWNYEIRCDLEE